jgi:small subunit ribosomal protein S1
MVNKRRTQEVVEGPPPIDESWWEAVLSEDEAQHAGGASKGHNHNHQRAISADEAGGRWAGGAQFSTNWEQATRFYEQDQVIEMLVTGCNRGGLLVNGEGVQGFVPVSHLIEMPCQVVDPEKWLQSYINQVLHLKIIECDQDRGRVVFSERAAQTEPGSRKHILENLRMGSCVNGKVTNITEFGVFVDLGGVEGLVHVSEISWGRVHHPADVVVLGEEVTVYVINVDKERARVALSLKRLHANPWESAEERYIPGQVTEAVVTSIVPFGAFARLEEGLDGLIHISEISGGSSMRPEILLKEGDIVSVRILHVDASRQRLGLSLRLSEPDAVENQELQGQAFQIS